MSKRKITANLKVIKDKVKVFAEQSLEMMSDSELEEQFDFDVNKNNEQSVYQEVECKVTDFKKLSSKIKKVKYSMDYMRAYLMCVDSLLVLDI